MPGLPVSRFHRFTWQQVLGLACVPCKTMVWEAVLKCAPVASCFAGLSHVALEAVGVREFGLVRLCDWSEAWHF